MIFSITIPDNKVQRVVDGICKRDNYDPDDGLTKQQFAKQQILEPIRQAFHIGNVEALKVTQATAMQQAVNDSVTEAEDITI